MTLSNALAQFKEASEELIKHGAISVSAIGNQRRGGVERVDVHIFNRVDFDAIPGEVEERYIDHCNSYELSKAFEGARFVYLLKNNEILEHPVASKCICIDQPVQ